MHRSILVLALALFAAMASAEPIDPNPNGIGIYADLEGRTNQVEVEIGQPMEVYVLVTRATGDGGPDSMMGGVEFTIIVPDNVTIWGWNTPLPGTMAATDPPNFMMAFDAVPYTDVIHVLTLIVVPGDDDPAQFYLTALQHPAGGEHPRFADAPDYELFDLTPYPGGQDNMTFVVNGSIVPGEETSWGGVKALYR
ncbi:MAG: hypothetical protein GY838_04510 [bacterium]|nr:hypothetical protein [bacterium]